MSSLDPPSPGVSGGESMVSSSSTVSLGSSAPVTLAELEFADHLAIKIRQMNPSAGSAEPSDDALQLREQAFRTMFELQQGLQAAENPYAIASDMLAVKHAMFDSCFKGAARLICVAHVVCLFLAIILASRLCTHRACPLAHDTLQS